MFRRKGQVRQQLEHDLPFSSFLYFIFNNILLSFLFLKNIEISAAWTLVSYKGYLYLYMHGGLLDIEAMSFFSSLKLVSYFLSGTSFLF